MRDVADDELGAEARGLRVQRIQEDRALGVDETHIAVVPEGSFFYRVTVVHEGAWVMEAINAEGSVFLDALNAQAARFGAQLVISHVAHQGRDRDASPASSSAPLP